MWLTQFITQIFIPRLFVCSASWSSVTECNEFFSYSGSSRFKNMRQSHRHHCQREDATNRDRSMQKMHVADVGVAVHVSRSYNITLRILVHFSKLHTMDRSENCKGTVQSHHRYTIVSYGNEELDSLHSKHKTIRNTWLGGISGGSSELHTMKSATALELLASSES